MVSDPTVRSEWRSARVQRLVTRTLAFCISAFLLYFVYRKVDVRNVLSTLQGAQWAWLALSVTLVGLILLLRALRFRWLLPTSATLGVGDAVRIMLVAGAFNVFLPAKTGDVVKAVIVARRGGAPVRLSVAVVIYERIADVFGLTMWCLIGLIVVPLQQSPLPPIAWIAVGAGWAFAAMLLLTDRAATSVLYSFQRIANRWWPRIGDVAGAWESLHDGLRGRRRLLMLFTSALWLAQLMQVWVFALVLSAKIPFWVCLPLAALAVLAAQAPLTVNGIGARDLALVILLSPYLSREVAAAIGLLAAAVGFLTPLAALPIIRPYLDIIFAPRPADA